jgi:hypothetical protein
MTDAEPYAGNANNLSSELVMLVNRVRGLYAALPEDLRTHGYRLGEVAGQLERAAGELARTAEDIARHRATPENSCPHESAGCPDHGATLSSTGGLTWCTVTGCRKQWQYDRMRFPCDQPTAYRVTDPQGDSGPVCAGHAWPVRGWEGWKVEPL